MIGHARCGSIEAATKVMDGNPDLAEKRPDGRWRNRRGMRSQVAHRYLEINLDVVWETALPALLEHLPASVGQNYPNRDDTGESYD